MIDQLWESCNLFVEWGLFSFGILQLRTRIQFDESFPNGQNGSLCTVVDL
jgi:hypothetical protein